MPRPGRRQPLATRLHAAVSPIQPDVGSVLLLVGSIGLHGCLLPVVLRTRWLWSCAILIVESSVGTASEYALLDQSASSRSNLSGKPSKRLERDIRSGAMRVQIKFPPTRLPAYQSRASRPHVQKNCVSIPDWGSAAKSGCRTTIRSERNLARGERFLRTPGTRAYGDQRAPAGGARRSCNPCRGVLLFLFYPGVRFAHPGLS